MATTDNVKCGRNAFLRHGWTDAYMLLVAADRDEPLQPDDLERLATAAYLIGEDAESMQIWVRAHQAFLGLGDVARATRCAFWLAFGLMHHGERARAGGWIRRAHELLENAHRDCVEQGYLLLPIALQRVFAGDAAGAYGMFCQAAEIGDRFGDRDLIALARHSRGRVLIRMGEIQAGVRLLDEAMIAVDAGEVSPLVVGDVYCSVIEGCLEVFDRAHRAHLSVAAGARRIRAGRAIGARFAVNHGDRLSRRQRSFDLEGLREELGTRWEPFLAYSLERARGPSAKIAGPLQHEFGLPRIPPEDLARIAVTTVLIWGRHDRANRLRIARDASARYGWPLHVIENCADDPPRDQPGAFLEALRVALMTEKRPQVTT